MPKMIKTVAACVAATLLLASCSGVGDGTKPESLKILQITSDTLFDEDFIRGEQVPGQAYTCVRGVLQAFIFFSDDDVGNFTRRVKWTSSDESILTVSNFDEDVPGTPGNKFDYGSIAPLRAGTVTVTATYLDMTASIPVTVDTAGAISVSPTDFRMAPLTFQSLRATAMLGGKKVDVTTQTVFDLNNGDPEAVAEFATLSNTGAIAAFKASDPLPIKAQLNVQGGDCATSPDATASVNLQVADIPARSGDALNLGLSLEPEAGFGPTLAEGTTQFLKAIARFGDFNSDGDANDPNEFQDLSFQSGALGTYTSSDTDAALFIGSSLLGRGSLLLGIADTEDAGVDPADDTAGLSLVYGAQPSLEPPNPGSTSNTLNMTVRDLLLRSIAITATAEREGSQGICTTDDAFGAVPETITGGKFMCFHATGTFGPAGGTDYVQDITKDVVWTTNVPTVLGLANGRVLGAGIATSATAAPTSGDADDLCVNATECDVTITATFTTNQLNVDGTAVTVPATAPITVVFPTPAP